MDKKKVCFILNVTPHYRIGIYEELDKIFDCYIVSGVKNQDIKAMDLSHFHHKPVYVDDIVFHGKKIWQKGILKYAFKPFDTYVMSEDIHEMNHWLFLILCKLQRKKVFAWTHGWYGKETKTTAFIKRRFYHLFYGIFTYGDHAKELMIKEGFKAERIWPIHNSLDYKKQIALRNQGLCSGVYIEHFGNDNPVIVFIGRLTAVKRLDLLIEAVKALPEYNLVFVGDGTERNRLELMTEAYGMNDRVWFYGASYNEEENAKLLYNADLCVAPGNVGLTAMHSMVYGCPVISHNDFKWQMPEYEAIKEGRTGAFFERGNVSSLADSIKQWFINHTDRTTVRNACYNVIDSDWNPNYQIDVFKKVLL